MITLALVQILYYVAIQWTSVTGGYNGLGIPLSYTTIGPYDPVGGASSFFPLGVLALAAVGLGTWRVINPPLGKTLMAIRENEERARHLGYNVDAFLHIAFVMSAVVSGFAGALYALLFGFASPQLLLWLLSSEVLLVTLIGGIGPFLGPVVGAIAFILLQESLVLVIDDWRMLFGALIMLFVLVAPEGVCGRYVEYKTDKQRDNPMTKLRERLDRLFGGAK